MCPERFTDALFTGEITFDLALAVLARAFLCFADRAATIAVGFGLAGGGPVCCFACDFERRRDDAADGVDATGQEQGGD